jgi:hypothetical protein
MRDYGLVTRRVEALNGDSIKRRELGRVLGEEGEYPIYGVSAGHAEDLPCMLIIGGTHGDEPSGVESALTFLEREAGNWIATMRFEVIPCLNPFCHVHDTRVNPTGVDLNWSFDRLDLPEIDIVRRLVDGRRFAAAVDLHEDWESPGFYLYELCRSGETIGHRIVDKVEQVCPINKNPVIEGDPARAGVIHPELDTVELRRRGEAIPLNIYSAHTDHLVTSETPTKCQMAKRVQAHLITLRSMIEAHVLG